MVPAVERQIGSLRIAESQRLPECAERRRCPPGAVSSRLFLPDIDDLRPGRWAMCCALAGIVLFAVGCNRVAENQPSDGRLKVFAGIPPLQYLAEQIGGQHVKVDVLVQPGQDPHAFQPSPQQVVALGQAAVFFKIDMPFEAVILEKVWEGNRRLAVVDATGGIEKLPFVGPNCERCSHEGHVAYYTDEMDPHVWLSPPLLKTMAANVAAGLCQADPAHKQDYRRNLAALVERLDTLHQQVRRKLAPYRGRAFYVFHPGFAYFADAYGLKEEAVQVGGQAPTAKQLRALIANARAEGVKTVFVQPEFDPRSAQVIADALGGRVVTINGLGKNVVADIEDIAAKMERAMREGSTKEGSAAATKPKGPERRRDKDGG
jgi:zinc transport system substrate-binding protein